MEEKIPDGLDRPFLRFAVVFKGEIVAQFKKIGDARSHAHKTGGWVLDLMDGTGD